MKCNCIEIVQEELRKEYPNAKLETGFTFPDMKEKLYIQFSYEASGKQKKKNTKALSCTFCPFCGKKVS